MTTSVLAPGMFALLTWIVPTGDGHAVRTLSPAERALPPPSAEDEDSDSPWTSNSDSDSSGGSSDPPTDNYSDSERTLVLGEAR